MKKIVVLLYFVSLGAYSSEVALGRLVSRALTTNAGVSTIASYLGIPESSIKSYSEAEIVRKLTLSEKFDEANFREEFGIVENKSILDEMKPDARDFITELISSGKFPQYRMESFMTNVVEISREFGKDILGETFGTCMKNFQVKNAVNLIAIIEAASGANVSEVFNSMLVKTQLVLTLSKTQASETLCKLANGECRILGDLISEQCI